MAAAPPFTLIIGQKRYSSWSLRPWLLLKHVSAAYPALAFSEEAFDVEGLGGAPNPRLLALSPSGLVPALRDGATGDVIWDSLAIAEWAADRAPAGAVWPADARARAFARCMAAEMHSGFSALRGALSMHVVMRLAAPLALAPAVAADVARITSLWAEARARWGAPSRAGPYLFGAFSAADAMFAPVVFRFVTYRVAPAEPLAAAYVAAMRADPFMREWERAAFGETRGSVKKYDDHLAALGGVRRSGTGDEEL